MASAHLQCSSRTTRRGGGIDSGQHHLDGLDAQHWIDTVLMALMHSTEAVALSVFITAVRNLGEHISGKLDRNLTTSYSVLTLVSIQHCSLYMLYSVRKRLKPWVEGTVMPALITF